MGREFRLTHGAGEVVRPLLACTRIRSWSQMFIPRLQFDQTELIDRQRCTRKSVAPLMRVRQVSLSISCHMKRQQHDIPHERARQFDLIAKATERTLKWAALESISLEHIEPVVPFVETDFSLDAWLFFDSENRIRRYRAEGIEKNVVARFREDLANVGYPPEWLPLVTCHIASKEVVDRAYRGSYYLFVR